MDNFGISAISIHSLRVEGDSITHKYVFVNDISIHSLRVEGDGRCDLLRGLFHVISIHSLRVEGDAR